MPEREISKIFIENLEKLLDQHNMTRSELSERLNVSKSTVSMWLTGSSLPRMDLLDKIADIFNVPAEYLVSSKSSEENSDKTPEQQYYLDDDARELADFMFKNPEYKVLFDASRKVSKEDIEFVKQLIDRMKKYTE